MAQLGQAASELNKAIKKCKLSESISDPVKKTEGLRDSVTVFNQAITIVKDDKLTDEAEIQNLVESYINRMCSEGVGAGNLVILESVVKQIEYISGDTWQSHTSRLLRLIKRECENRGILNKEIDNAIQKFSRKSKKDKDDVSVILNRICGLGATKKQKESLLKIIENHFKNDQEIRAIIKAGFENDKEIQVLIDVMFPEIAPPKKVETPKAESRKLDDKKPEEHVSKAHETPAQPSPKNKQNQSPIVTENMFKQSSKLLKRENIDVNVIRESIVIFCNAVNAVKQNGLENIENILKEAENYVKELRKLVADSRFNQINVTVAYKDLEALVEKWDALKIRLSNAEKNPKPQNVVQSVVVQPVKEQKMQDFTSDIKKAQEYMCKESLELAFPIIVNACSFNTSKQTAQILLDAYEKTLREDNRLDKKQDLVDTHLNGLREYFGLVKKAEDKAVAAPVTPANLPAKAPAPAKATPSPKAAGNPAGVSRGALASASVGKNAGNSSRVVAPQDAPPGKSKSKASENQMQNDLQNGGFGRYGRRHVL